MELLLPPLLTLLPLVVLVLVPWSFFAIAELFEGFPRLRLRQVLGLLGLLVLVGGPVGLILVAEFGTWAIDGDWFLYGGLLAALAWLIVGPVLFCGMWVREFRLLMLRRDDEFPGRSDKLAWIFALTLLAPAGVWLSRSYRMARWPANAPTSEAPTSPEPEPHRPED